MHDWEAIGTRRWGYVGGAKSLQMSPEGLSFHHLRWHVASCRALDFAAGVPRATAHRHIMASSDISEVTVSLLPRFINGSNPVREQKPFYSLR